MPLTNKYLKYSSDITLEIFTLIWDKLIENGCKFEYSKEIIFERFKFHKRVLRYESNGNYVYPLTGNNSCKETTVQEILGYDPFVKEEVVPEYVECINIATCNTKVGEIFKCRHSNGCFEWEYNNKSMRNYNSWDGWSVPWSDKLPQNHFKPSTKEAFDAQNKPIEKWSVGSYVVFLRDVNSTKKGSVDLIKTGLEPDNAIYLEKYLTLDISREQIGEIKWFATKSEAEEFAKTLVEPVKHGNGILDAVDVKQPLKQVVHCKTQEEWDFVSNKIGYKFINKFELGNSDTINPVSKGCQSKSFFEGHEEYQILSFQEWCDLNGYKMETNIDLTGRHLRALIDGPQSTIYKKGDIVDIFKKESSNQYRIGKVGDGWWTYTTNNGTESQWELLPEDYKMEKKAKFEVGDYVVLENAGGWSYSTCNDGCLGLITKIGNFKPSTVTDYICSISGNILNSNNKDTTFRDIPIAFYNRKWIVRYATPEEINNHLISIGQIPVGEPLNTGVEPNKDGMFKYTTYNGTTVIGKTSTISGPLKMTLSIDDEELPMVNIIKTNTIKQLLNVE